MLDYQVFAQGLHAFRCSPTQKGAIPSRTIHHYVEL